MQTTDCAKTEFRLDDREVNHFVVEILKMLDGFDKASGNNVLNRALFWHNIKCACQETCKGA